MALNTPEELEAAFRESEHAGALGPGAARRRLLPESQLDVFAEVRFPKREWVLVVDGGERLDDRDLLLAAGIHCRAHNGSVEVVATQDTDRQLFCTLLADLVKQLAFPSSAPATALLRRLTSWRRMLGQGLATGLAPEARIGLYGELLVLRELILPALGDRAVRSWAGPSGGAQDFVHGCVALEVKTVTQRSGELCRISSERQLDSAGLTDLFLVHQVLAASPEGTSLGDLVDELREASAVGVDRGWFENCLLEAGWLDTHRDQYANDRFVLVRRRCLTVADGFPRLTTAQLPPGVSGVSYLIDLAACLPHRVEEAAVGFTAAKATTAGEE